MKDCGTVKYVECHGKPYDMGVQYGKQAKREIDKMLKGEAYKWINPRIVEDKKFVCNLKDKLSKLLPNVYEELKGIADGAEQKLDAIMLLNHYNNPVDKVERCTPVGLISKEDGVLISKNNDGAPGEKVKYPFVIRKSVPDKAYGLPMIQVTYAGWLSGLDAMNGAGLANTHGSVGSAFSRCASDIDIRLAGYHAMRYSENIEEFKNSLREFNLSGKGFNILVGDAAGNTLVIEAAVPLLIERAHNQKFLYTTNHYISECIKNSDGRTPKGKEISTYRFGYLKWREESKPPENMKDLKALLSSHEPWAPCRHAGPHVSETQWSMICSAKTKTVFLADNNPCKNKYMKFSI
ncbi:MAG: hypothetical protein A2017_15935 [Lentisphaerae bacterium GWF2_44_16]|nr:MAG: hypothetical protein A2017_15935 [Lentisphaerae bacterium GWF2_44_16]